MDKRTQLATILLGIGVVLLLLGTFTHAWWVAGRGDVSVGLGLRGGQACARGECKTASYDEMLADLPERVMSSSERSMFTTAGTVCFFGAFLLVAAALGTLGALHLKMKLPVPLPRIASALALLLTVSALVFVVSKPTLGMGGLSTGYATICYMLGAFTLLVGAQAAAKAMAPPPPPDPTLSI